MVPAFFVVNRRVCDPDVNHSGAFTTLWGEEEEKGDEVDVENDP